MKIQINQLRRTFLRWVTSKLASASPKKPLPKEFDYATSRVLIVRPNHRLGNQILISPIIAELIASMPHCKIDLLLQGNLGPLLFQNVPQINTIIKLPRKPFKELGRYLKTIWNLRAKEYDFAINAVQYSSSGRLYTMFSNARYKIVGQEKDATILNNTTDSKHIAKYQLYTVRNYLKQLNIPVNEGPATPLTIFLNEREKEQGKTILDSLVPDSKKTIAIYTFATGGKCLPKSWWVPFYERLKASYPEHNILEILPAENVSQINFVATHWYSRELREIAGVIANCEVWIGADCGIMHLACASKTPTLALFSGYNVAQYVPYNRGSKAIIQPENNHFTEDIFNALQTLLEPTH
jgi:ADP-heptose:LPS heptosyltransferase